MKKILLNLIGKISSGFSMEWLIRMTNQPFLLPVYHLSSDEEAPHIKHIYPIRNSRLFKQDLDLLLKHYEPIDLNDVKRHITGEQKITKKAFFLSFDDGLREIYNVVAPILKEKGIPATFFINSDFVDNRRLFYRYKASLLINEILTKNWSKDVLNQVFKELDRKGIQEKDIKSALLKVSYHQQEILDKIAEILNFSFEDFLNNYKPYLTKEQIQSLMDQGFSIGAHSVDHPEYQFLSLEEQIVQTKGSVNWLSDTFQPQLNSFAFPFTDYGVKRNFFENAWDQKIFDLSFGCAGIKTDSFDWHLHRLPMEGNLENAAKIIKTAYLYYLIKKPLGKNRIIR